MGKVMRGHALLVYGWIEMLFILMIPACGHEGLHDDISFVVTRCTQQKLFMENKGSGGREQTIAHESL